MNIFYGILIGLAAFDLVILTLLHRWLRASAPLDRRALLPTLAGLAGFVFHAFLFFEGAILILQLATYAGFVILYLLACRKPLRPVESVTRL